MVGGASSLLLGCAGAGAFLDGASLGVESLPNRTCKFMSMKGLPLNNLIAFWADAALSNSMVQFPLDLLVWGSRESTTQTMVPARAK